ncbi:MAG: permease, partial [Candidatus Humimicrobiaceae bacterium]
MKIFRRYLFFIIALALLGIVFIFNVSMGIKAVSTLTYSLKEMALVLPPIFILLGLLDVWISKEKMMKYV